ncbi:hypothetical protein SPBR_01416 [Sporothrix brasiliensis 5110]|uniref:2-dehydropantoate 2-reductase n=1 Tax=Sporothrix brasiliensis 5110 TaxID=1398154 RepID=A0A0C2EXV0_9PEZI|nr:uncharacterized protein SPBR_01416 [Sporothrix brasiliensis 5110]KIH91509.1 hypothetical protein SPBR_01416 [Sporothrix brasiliensis 5110]
MALLVGARSAGTHAAPARAVLLRLRSSCGAASAVAASRHTSSHSPPPFTETSSSLPSDYHLPFGNPSLLIPTLSKHEPTILASPRASAASATAQMNATRVPSTPDAPTPSEPSQRAPQNTSQRPPARPFSNPLTSSPKVPKPTQPISKTILSAGRRLGRVTGAEPDHHRLEPKPIRQSSPPPPLTEVEEDPDDYFRILPEEDEETRAEPATETRPTPREPIHVLGGNIQATYLAHMLAGLPSNPEVHIVHLGYHQARKWDSEGERVEVLRGNKALPHNPVIGEYAGPNRRPSRSSNVVRPRSFDTVHRPIENLIVTMTCAASIGALEQLAPRINSRTTICLLQPGLGVVERINELCFPYIPDRPSYILGHMTHLLGYTENAFSVVENVPGRVVLTHYTPPDQLVAEGGELVAGDRRAIAASDDDDFDSIIADGEIDADGNSVSSSSSNSKSPPTFVPELPPAPKRKREGTDGNQSLELEYSTGMRLMYLLNVTPELGAGGYSTAAFLRYKLPELVYAAAVEPVQTVLDLPMGNALWSNGPAWSMVEDLVREMINVILQMPETRASPKLAEYVRSGAFERKVFRLSYRKSEGRTRRPGPGGSSHSDDGDAYRGSGPQSAQNDSGGYCLMARRVALGQGTDIEFLNGYFVRRGKALGVACPHNEMIIKMVRAKQRSRVARPSSLQIDPSDPGQESHIPFAPPSGPYVSASGKFPKPEKRKKHAGKQASKHADNDQA